MNEQCTSGNGTWYHWCKLISQVMGRDYVTQQPVCMITIFTHFTAPRALRDFLKSCLLSCIGLLRGLHDRGHVWKYIYLLKKKNNSVNKDVIARTFIQLLKANKIIRNFALLNNSLWLKRSYLREIWLLICWPSSLLKMIFSFMWLKAKKANTSIWISFFAD